MQAILAYIVGPDLLFFLPHSFFITQPRLYPMTQCQCTGPSAIYTHLYADKCLDAKILSSDGLLGQRKVGWRGNGGGLRIKYFVGFPFDRRAMSVKW